MHPTSLPGEYGIGELGPYAYRFIDDLFEMGITLWQVLPLCPTDLSHSPYSALSSFAGNHLLISSDFLIRDGLLKTNELKKIPQFKKNKIDFHSVIKYKHKILAIVCKLFFKRASKKIIELFKDYCDKNSYWLDSYSKFWFYKNNYGWNKSWKQWNLSNSIKNDELINSKILQFLFDFQWKSLKKYCNSKNIQIIGDFPIYVSYESSDVWSNKNLFKLNNNNSMQFISGCPPCDFNKNGQLWGNPIYNWKQHKETEFKWFILRFKKLYEMVDIIRLDHFIGYSKYWSIPSNMHSAKLGKWKNAPGEYFFSELRKKINLIKIFVEDLGAVPKKIIKLRKQFNFQGMKILQFEFKGNNFKNIDIVDTVLYTGTHDNNTLKGWIDSLPLISKKNELSKKKLMKIFTKDLIWEIISFACQSKSKWVIIPFLDILELDSSSRFNTPGTLSDNNWSWRFENNQLKKGIIYKMKKILIKTNRIKNINDQ